MRAGYSVAFLTLARDCARGTCDLQRRDAGDAPGGLRGRVCKCVRLYIHFQPCPRPRHLRNYPKLPADILFRPDGLDPAGRALAMPRLRPCLNSQVSLRHQPGRPKPLP